MSSQIVADQMMHDMLSTFNLFGYAPFQSKLN